MNNTPNTRALQHLLIQGFTPYTCAAAVSLRLVSSSSLDTHPWAVVMDGQGSRDWCTLLPEEDPLRPLMFQAAENSSSTSPTVLCHLQGTFLIIPLTVDEVRHAGSRLEVAKNLNVTPPSLDGIKAIPLDVLEQEMKRRRRELKGDQQDQPPESAQD